MLKSAFGRLSTGVCRQPQWVYGGVFMYSLAGCNRFYGILLPADYAPACADSLSGLWRGVYVFIARVAAGSTAYSFQRFMLRRRQTAAVGLWRGVYVLIARVGALSFLRIMHRRVQTAAVGLCRGVYVFIGRVHPVLRSELYLIIHAEMPLRLFMDFSAGSLCIFNRNITASQEKLYLILRAALSPT